MSTLTARLAKVNETAKSNDAVVMWSADGAKFQEAALNILDFKGSDAHKMIGSLVTAINNNQISASEAMSIYKSALSN